jgi:hypothetical protein
MLQRLISIMLVALLGSVVLAQQGSRVILSEKELEKARTDDATRAALERKIPSMKFNDVRLIEAIDFLRDVSGANIHVNWRAIEKAGIERDTLLHIQVTDVTLAKALKLVLGDASTDAVELKWVVDEGVIEIAPAETFEQQLSIIFSDVRDLTDAKDDDKARKLIDLICETVAPATWVQNGGQSSIRCFDGTLVIIQTQENHDAVAHVLKRLRDFRPKRENTAGPAISGRSTGTN